MVGSGGARARFRFGALVHVCGHSFSFMVGVIVSGCLSLVGGGHCHP